MESYQKLFAIGVVLLASPFIHPLLVLLNEFLTLVVPVGFVTIVLGAVVMISETK
ncbi:hypothetical protein ACFQH6_11915 [Halobacteriaceae archaeon GCM10025711]